MKTLFATRHAQPRVRTPDRDPDYPAGNPYLSELGREQARCLGLRLREEGDIECIYASPYHRTMETADIVAEIIGAEIIPEPRFREMTGENIARFEGHTIAQLRTLFRHVARDAELAFPWWTLAPEALDEHGRRPLILERVTHLIDALRERHERDVLLVGHGASLGAAYHYLLDRSTPPDDAPTFYGWNCALLAATLQPAIQITLWGDTRHLPEKWVTSNGQSAAEILCPR